MTYEDMIADAAKRLEKRMRQTAGRTYVIAKPTTAERNGSIEIIGETEQAALGETVIYPCTNNAKAGAVRWEIVPYSDLYHVLWTALRREPILPIH